MLRNANKMLKTYSKNAQHARNMNAPKHVQKYSELLVLNKYVNASQKYWKQ